MTKNGVNSEDNRLVHGAYSSVWERALNGDIDTRTSLVRAMNRLRRELTRDCGGDPSAQERILIDRAVMKTFRLQSIETAMMDGKADKADPFYISLSNSLRHDLQALGLARRAKNLTTLGDLLMEQINEQQNK